MGDKVSFKDIDSIIKNTYNSVNEDIVKNFYIPVLSEAKRYDRISGYFDSSSLAIAARGMGEFIKNGGHMRILCGTQLFPQDLEVIKNASDIEKIISDKFLDDLSNIEDELINDHIKVLGWMIANNILEIKVGINKKNGKYIGGGILHSKSGILWDNSIENSENPFDHCIVFTGSNNETAAGWVSNIEYFTVFKGWKNSEFMLDCINDFPKFWKNENENLEVMDIPKADKQALIERAPNNIYEVNQIIKKYYKKNISKDKRILFEHQKKAIKAWFDNNKKGILEMATGTGKTFTALNCLKELNDKEENLITVIACPYAHLVEQWYSDLKNFDIAKIYKCYGSGNYNWKKDLFKLIRRVSKGKIKKAIILTTHDTFSMSFFKDKIKSIDGNLFLIADEMHHLGAENYSTGLLDKYNYRLGLSATPEKFMDEKATEYLMEYFGGIIFRFDLEDALTNINPKTNETYLTPYYYFPEKINLNSNELKKYNSLTQDIAAIFNDDDKKESLDLLLIKRKDILNNAEEKYTKLRKILREKDNWDHLIVFCSPQQINNVLKILKEENVNPVHRFTSKEKNTKDKKLGGISQREDLLRKFDNGEYKALVAIKCLDEGVDVPSADKVIIMSSSRNPMEYIQRRGRVLRRYPGKYIASIYDMMIIPNSNENFPDSIIKKELERCEDFILESSNKMESNKKLVDWGVLN